MSIMEEVRKKYFIFLKRVYHVGNKEDTKRMALATGRSLEEIKREKMNKIKEDVERNIDYLITSILLCVRGWGEYYVGKIPIGVTKEIEENPAWLSLIERGNEEFISLILGDKVYVSHCQVVSRCVAIGTMFLRKNSLIENIKENILKWKGNIAKVDNIWMVSSKGSLSDTDVDRLVGHVLKSYCIEIKLKKAAKEAGIKIKENKIIYPVEIE